jgi:hypothetical protein
VSLPHYEPEPTVDNRRLTEDTVQLWRKHDVIPHHEDVEGFVALISCTGQDRTGAEYRRARRMPSTGLTVGQMRQLLLNELQALETENDRN